ncbi:MAG: TIGR03621 family F420-dependent LLM class oxidoreductase [Chloroflexota bacterium]|nr:TIGR03621 family F420-dependent LLM class oxidoreductase [Chloroflexota bacterium]
MHPLRFAVRSTGGRSADSWTGRARRAEELGYSALLMPDHLISGLSPVPAIAAAAAATTKLRVGVHVFDNDYRNPVLFAREMATIDVLSRGRLELGIGAGWMRSDYRQLGMTYDPPKVRVDRLVEAITILKRLFAGETVDHQGRHYRLHGARLSPAPVQKPHPPLVVGGGGPRMMRIAAREADIVSFIPRMSPQGRPTLREGTTDATAAKVARLKQAAGPRFERLELSAWVAHVNVADGRAPFTAIAAGLEGVVARLIGTPYLLAGSRREIREQILRYRDRLGLTYWTIPAEGMDAFAPIVEALAGR